MWQRVGPRDELAGWLTAVLLRADVSQGRQADALYAAAVLRERAGDLAGAGEALARARGIATQIGDDRRLAWVTAFEAWQATLMGDPSQAELLTARAVALAEGHREATELSSAALQIQGLAAREPGLAISHFEDGLKFARAHGLDVTALVLLANLAERTLVVDRPDRARRLADEGIALAGALEAVENAGVLHGLRAYAHLQLGDDQAAIDDAVIGIRHAVAVAGDGYGRQSLVFLAAAMAADRPDRAAHLLGISDAGRAGAEHPSVEQANERYLAGLPARLGPRFAPAYDSGRELVAERGLLGAMATILLDPQPSLPQGSPSGVR